MTHLISSLAKQFSKNKHCLSRENQIKAEVYVNQDKSLSDLQTLIKHSFLLYFPRELLMNFLIIHKVFCA